jgi:hypothetical protein
MQATMRAATAALRALLLGAFLMTLAPPALAAGGRFILVVGEVIVASGGGPDRRVERGDTVNEGDFVQTAHDSQAQIRMDDGQVLSLRPGSRIFLRAYKWEGSENGNEQSIVELVRGALRSLTGRIGGRDKSRVSFLVSNITIGVRGTDHEIALVPPPQAGAGQAGGTPGDAPGVYNRVISGATYIASGNARIDVNPGQVGFAPAGGEAPRLVPLPNVMRGTGPVGGAAKGAGKGPDKGNGKAGDKAAEKGGDKGGDKGGAAKGPSPAGQPGPAGPGKGPGTAGVGPSPNPMPGAGQPGAGMGAGTGPGPVPGAAVGRTPSQPGGQGPLSGAAPGVGAGPGPGPGPGKPPIGPPPPGPLGPPPASLPAR